MPKKYTHLLFDADGTLFDFEKTEHQAFADTMEKYAIPYSADWLLMYKNINISYWKMLEKGLITKDELLPKRFADFLDKIKRTDLDPRELNRTYLSRLGQYAFLSPGALDVCRILSEKYTLLLVTNGVYSTQVSRFDKTPLKQYFTEMIVSEKIGYTKPDPRYFDYVFDRHSISDKSKAIIIGDSLSADIKGGRDYGIDTCFYNPENLPVEDDVCTFNITKLEQLVERLF